MPDIIVIGGGASGLLAAGTAAREGSTVTVIEHMPRPARKVMITGKGRCNLTNNTDLNGLISSVPVNGKFLYSAFSSFGSSDTVRLFESLGVPLKTERGNRVFPRSDKAVDIVDALIKYAAKADIVRAEVSEILTDIGEDGPAVKGVKCSDGNEYFADRVILATGGMSYPLTGSNGSGYSLAKNCGHTVTKLRPALIPLVAHEGFCENLQGLSLKNVAVKITEKGKEKSLYSDFGEMLFTHYGVSGPVILSASAHMPKIGETSYTLHIDLKPALSPEELDARLLRDFQKFSNKDFCNALDELLPRKLIPVIVKLSEIPPKCKVNSITKQQRRTLCELLKNFCLTAVDTRPIEEAIITCGGVKCSEIDPKTMSSKLCKGLYFAGEIIDVNAYTGGYNLQIAFSTGYLAGKSASKENVL